MSENKAERKTCVDCAGKGYISDLVVVTHCKQCDGVGYTEIVTLPGIVVDMSNSKLVDIDQLYKDVHNGEEPPKWKPVKKYKRTKKETSNGTV